MKGLWALALIALIAAGFISVMAPASDASAQGNPAGAGLTIRDLATTADPTARVDCGSTATVPPAQNPAGACREVGLIFQPGSGTIQLVVTGSTSAGNATVSVPSVGTIGGQSFFIYTGLPVSQQSACFQLVITNGSTTSRSDTVCEFWQFFDGTNIARGTVPTNFQATLALGNSAAAYQWDPIGATTYGVFEWLTDGIVPTNPAGSTSITVPLVSLPLGNGATGFQCAIAIGANDTGAGFVLVGASNGLCVEAGTSSNLNAFPTNTRTNTVTGTPPTATSTNTAVGAPTSTNTATRTNTPVNTNTATTGPSATPTVTNTLTPANVVFSKTYIGAPNAVSAGANMTFLINVSNLGQTAATGQHIVDSFPAGIVPVSANDQTNPFTTPGFGCGISSQLVDCVGATINGGQTRTIAIGAFVQNPCVVTSPINNEAILNPDPVTGLGPTASVAVTVNGCAQATLTPTLTRTSTATRTVTPTATITNTPTATNTPGVDLVTVKIDAPDPVTNPGNPVTGQIQYTILVTNNGPLTAGNVTVTDLLEDGSTFTCGSSPVGVCNASDPNGNNAVFFLSASGTNGFNCPAPTLLEPFTVSCTGGNIGPNGGGATILINVQTNVGCQFILNYVTAGGPADSNPNNNSAFTQTACGAGANTPTILPSNTITLTPTKTQTLTTTPTVTLTPIPSGKFTFTKQSDTNPVTTGQVFNYILTFANTSGADVTTLDVTDALSTDVSFVGVTNSFGANCLHTGANPGGTVVCQGGTIADGNTNATVTIQVVVNPDCSNTASPILNTATVQSPNVVNKTATSSTTVTGCNTITPTNTLTSTITLTPTKTNTPTNTPTVTSTPTPAFDLSIAKTGPASLTFNQSFNYTVTVTNLGPNAAAGISVLDVLPPAANYSFSSVTPSLWTTNPTCTFNAGPNTISCNGGALNNGVAGQVVINGTVTTAACGTTLTNTATITDPADLNAANNAASTSAPVAACANLNMAFTDVSPVFADIAGPPNWETSARYTLSNTGPQTITGITFSVHESNVGNPTFSSGNSAINGTVVFNNPATVVASWSCSVAFVPGNPLENATWTCTGSLTSGQTVNLDFEIDGPAGDPQSATTGVATWDPNTVSCTSPTPCTNNTVSNANTDGSQLIFGPDTDPIGGSADLDISAFVDSPAGENLAAAGTPTVSEAQYTLFNDGRTAITGVTFGGVISGTAPRSSVSASINNGGGTWSCTSTVNAWSCTGNLAASGTPDTNTPDGASSQVTVTLATIVVGGATGQTVVYTPSAPTCGSPSPCTNNTVSAANADGSTTLYAADTDTLT